MIGRTPSFTGSKFGIKNETNKQNKKYFLAKTNFFSTAKNIYTLIHYTLLPARFRHFFRHASGTLPARQALAKSATFIPDFFPKNNGSGGWYFLKIKGERLHPFPLFLSLSSSLSSSTCKLPIYCLFYCLSTYLYPIYMCDVRYTYKYSMFCVHSFVFACLFV